MAACSAGAIAGPARVVQSSLWMARMVTLLEVSKRRGTGVPFMVSFHHLHDI